jgi:hypothetical protein
VRGCSPWLEAWLVGEKRLIDRDDVYSSMAPLRVVGSTVAI